MRGQRNLRFNPSDNCVPPKSEQHCGIRTVHPPLIPSGVVEFMREVLRALLLAAARCAYALEFAELQCVVPRKVTWIDLKPVHPAEQQVGVRILIGSWLGHSCPLAVAASVCPGLRRWAVTKITEMLVSDEAFYVRPGLPRFCPFGRMAANFAKLLGAGKRDSVVKSATTSTQNQRSCILEALEQLKTQPRPLPAALDARGACLQIARRAKLSTLIWRNARQARRGAHKIVMLLPIAWGRR